MTPIEALCYAVDTLYIRDTICIQNGVGCGAWDDRGGGVQARGRAELPQHHVPVAAPLRPARAWRVRDHRDQTQDPVEL